MNPFSSLVCGVAVFSLFISPASAQSLEGDYKCEGSGPNGADAYSGKVVIKKNASVYPIKWDLGKDSAYVGTGIVVGDVLAAAYGGGKPYGLVVYKVSGGKLAGQWVIGGTTALGEENLEGPDGLSGTYTITSAKNASGNPYTGKVSMTKNGGTFSLNWTLPNESYSGVGILHGDLLVVGWGKGEGYGAVAYDVKGSTLSGKWAAANMDTLGSETLTK